ncbi:MAG TPA: hypothetical protein GX699_00060 [Firmicutes bacterium]|nr:hypothetical protein [Bacillota bacterium]
MLDVIIFEGGNAKSPVEKMLVAARHAALKDNLQKISALPEVERIILVTNQPSLAALAGLPRVCVETNNLSPEQFHFGRQLQNLVDRYRCRAVLCMGGAAVPLMAAEEWSFVCREILAGEKRYVTNNVQSADLIAFNPAAVIKQYAPPATDNALALLLRYDARFTQILLPVTLGTQFDIDTPTDLLILAASPFGGRELRAALDSFHLRTDRLQQLKTVLCGQYEEVALIGRVGAPAISRINKHFKVRLRVFSEERGMKALGRLERNEVVSLLGYWIDEIGPEKFFARLADTVAAALIDTRVLFAHRKKELSDADRFYSDLGEHELIADPFVREFTRAAKNCGIPVILGGHSLVTGGIFALAEELGCQF